MNSKIKIYGWDNNPGDHDWHIGYAMAEDGTVVSSHCSSSHDWARYDISERHHEYRVKKYGEDGFEFIWLENPKADAGWLAAMELNRKQGEIAKLKAVVAEECEVRV